MVRQKTSRTGLVQPLVFRVELRQDHDQHLHLSDRPVPCAGWNHDALARPHRNQLVVQLHLGIVVTLEEVIRLGQPLVVVELGIGRDFGDVDRPRIRLDVGERTPGRSAGTLGAGDLGKIDQVVFGTDWPFDMAIDWPVSWLLGLESLTSEEKEAILFKNLEKLLGI